MENGTVGAEAAEAPKKKPKLTRLKIERFRNVEPCELRFGDGFNVLLGLNGSGKTTLLELIAAVLSSDFSLFRNEAFAVEYDVSLSTGTIKVAMRSERVERPQAPMLPVHDVEMFGLSAKLNVLRTSPPQSWIVCADTASVWLMDKPSWKMSLPTNLGEHGSSLLWLAVHLTTDASLKGASDEARSWHSIRRFDEALDMFRAITSPATWIDTLITHSAAIGIGFHVVGVFPQELIDAIVGHVSSMASSSQGLTIPDRSLDFLREAGMLFGFKLSRLEMRLESKAGGAAVERLRFSDLRFMFEGHDGSITRHDHLSYGQKRLLAFYYYLAASPITVIADELVDGLHHLWIDAAIEAIGDRQAFLASQNPLLLDHLEFESAEQVASTFITCRAERTADGEKHMIWANLSPYDAERFFRAYKVDVKHVSEILLSKGLW